VSRVRDTLGPERVSEARACAVLSQPRSNQRRPPEIADDEARLVERMTALARKYGRYGYRRITEIAQALGITYSTVSVLTDDVREKQKVKTTAEAVQRWRRFAAGEQEALA